MASEVDRLIFRKTGVDPDLSGNHIRCFCHKIALILNAGLRSLKLSTKGLVASKNSTLGFAPHLTPIVEESEEIDKSDQFVTEDVILRESSNNGEFSEKDIESNGSNNAESDEEPDSWDTPTKGKNSIDLCLKKVDFVIQRITSSAAKRSEYYTWCKKLDFDGPNLIAGYGICWNIKFQSRDRGYRAREIIAKLIENENNRLEQEGGKHFYSNIQISRDEWKIVHRLNQTLSEFYYLTKKMEGDYSSACLLISEYQHIKSFVKKKMESSSDPDLSKMFTTMLTKTNTYLNKALKCDAILVATVLNPSFRLSIFKLSFPAKHEYTFNLMNKLVKTQKAQVEAASVPSRPAPPVVNKPKSSKKAREEIDYFPDAVEAPCTDELKIYLGGKYKLPTSEASGCLKWWK
ncbi:hypothetical protein PTTG_30242, partial [Puccinia triticina 1-1 BBBD Race 1]